MELAVGREAQAGPGCARSDGPTAGSGGGSGSPPSRGRADGPSRPRAKPSPRPREARAACCGLHLLGRSHLLGGGKRVRGFGLHLHGSGRRGPRLGRGGPGFHRKALPASAGPVSAGAELGFAARRAPRAAPLARDPNGSGQPPDPPAEREPFPRSPPPPPPPVGPGPASASRRSSAFRRATSCETSSPSGQGRKPHERHLQHREGLGCPREILLLLDQDPEHASQARRLVALRPARPARPAPRRWPRRAPPRPRARCGAPRGRAAAGSVRRRGASGRCPCRPPGRRPRAPPRGRNRCRPWRIEISTRRSIRSRTWLTVSSSTSVPP